MRHLVASFARLQHRITPNETDLFTTFLKMKIKYKKSGQGVAPLTALRMRCYVASALSLG